MITFTSLLVWFDVICETSDQGLTREEDYGVNDGDGWFLGKVYKEIMEEVRVVKVHRQITEPVQTIVNKSMVKI